MSHPPEFALTTIDGVKVIPLADVVRSLRELGQAMMRDQPMTGTAFIVVSEQFDSLND